MCTLIKVPDGSLLASTGMPGDSAAGYLGIWWALLILGAIALIYTVMGGFLAVLMTDVIQFGVLLSVVVFLIPLSFHAVGGVGNFIDSASRIPGFFSGSSETYTWGWLLLWVFLNVGMIGGDWPFVQRYISVPTRKDARKSTYLIGLLYFLTPVIWYLPTMIYRVMEPGMAMDVDAATMTYNGEHAYVNMSKLVLMSGMVGMMLAAMLSATLSNVSGILNVYANVFTYDIWKHKDKNRNADERTLMKGRAHVHSGFRTGDHRTVDAHTVRRRSRKSGRHPADHDNVPALHPVNLGTFLQKAHRQPTHIRHAGDMGHRHHGKTCRTSFGDEPKHDRIHLRLCPASGDSGWNGTLVQGERHNGQRV